MKRTRRQTLRRGACALGVGLGGCIGGDSDEGTATPRDDAGTPTDETTVATEEAEATPSPTTAPQSTPGPGHTEDPATVTTTTTQPGVAWRFDLAAEVDAAPALADGTIYVGGWRQTGGTPTGDDDEGPSTTLRGIGIGDGREQLRVPVGAPIQTRPRVVGDQIYVVRGYNGLHGHDYQVRGVSTDGDPLWQHQAQSLKFLRVLGADDSGIVVGEHDDNLGEGNEETVALSPDGAARWRADTTDVYDGTTDEETTYVSDYRGRVRAFNRSSGDELWTVERESQVRQPTVTDGGMVGAGATVFSLDQSDGSVRWTYGEATPRWLFVDDGRAFVPTDDGRLVVLDVADGSRLWEIAIGDRSPFAIGDDAVYASQDGTVSAYDRSGGGDLWETALGDDVGLLPAGVRVYAHREGSVTALHADDGKRVGSVAVDGDPRWVVAEDGRAAVATPKGLVYGLEL